MAKLSRNKFRPTPSMNVTPLVDVVLVLLIIFMVIIPAMEKDAPVELPGIINVDEEAKGKTDPFTLSLTADGSMFFEQDKLEPDQFMARLNEAKMREPLRRLILRADRNARYADVRALFKACQEVGIPGISLRVNELKQDNAKH